MDSPRRAVSVTLSNLNKQSITFQADALLWKQDNGRDVYSPIDDLLVVPPIAEIPANGKQVFRVVLRHPAQAPVERSYRLIFEDISTEATGGEGAQIALRFAHNLPVMVAPFGKVVNAVRWKPCLPEVVATAASTPATPSAARGAEACVRLLNAGNRRVKVQTLTLSGDGWQRALSLKAGENVLAGAEREWRVPLAKEQEGALRSVQVQTARGETLQAEAGGF